MNCQHKPDKTDTQTKDRTRQLVANVCHNYLKNCDTFASIGDFCDKEQRNNNTIRNE